MKAKSLSVLLVVLASATVISPAISKAPAGKPQQFTATKKKVIGETMTLVSVGTYSPALPVHAIHRTQERDNTPEGATIALLSAMAAGDYQWWLSNWSPESRTMMTKQYQKSGRKPTETVASWKGMLNSRPAVILGRADYRQDGKAYALVRYRTTNANELTAKDKVTGKVSSLGATDVEEVLSFRLHQGQWVATRELASDPLFHNASLLWDTKLREINLKKMATANLSASR